jgi:hypothetical protein
MGPLNKEAAAPTGNCPMLVLLLVPLVVELLDVLLDVACAPRLWP